MVNHERPPGNPGGVRELARWCWEAEAFLREMSARTQTASLDIRGGGLALRGAFVVALAEDSAGVPQILGQLADRYRMVSDACGRYADVLEDTQLAWGRAADRFEMFDRNVQAARVDLREAVGETLVGMAVPLLLPLAAVDAVSAKQRYDSAKFEADAVDREAGWARERWLAAEAECASAIKRSFTADALAVGEKDREARQLGDFDRLFVAGLRRRSPAQVRAWWEALTLAEQATLLERRPGELSGLEGLPSDVIDEAQRRYFRSVAKDVTVAETEASVEALVNIEVARIPLAVGGSITLIEKRYADGHVTIELRAEAVGGLSLEQAKVLATAGVNGIFRFADQSEAEEFMEGFLRALKPSLSDLVPGPLDLVTGGLNPANHIMRHEVENIVGYLSGHRNQLDVIGWGLGRRGVLEKGGLGAAGFEGELSGGARLEVVDLSETAKAAGGKPHVELKASLEGKAEASLDKMRMSGRVKIEGSLIFQGSTPEKVRLSLEGDQVRLPGEYGSTLDLGIGGGGVGAKVELELDLTDPRNKHLIDLILPALRCSDLEAVARALDATWDRTAVVVQGTTIEQPVDIGVDLKGVEVGGSVRASTAAFTIVKPPGGHFYRADEMARGGGSW